jgi:phosphoglycerate dehydrogenase-like enzyme
MVPIAFILGASAFQDIYGEEVLTAIAPSGRLLGPPLTNHDLRANPPPWLAEIEVLFTGWGGPRLTPETRQRFPRLRAVFHGAGSLRSIVSEETWPDDVVFASAAALNAIPTSEFAFGAILLSLKRAWQCAAVARQRRTFPFPHLPTPGALGSTVGLVSLGQIGCRVAERLQTLDVNVIAHDPFAPPELFAELGVTACSLEELFARADVVSLHTPLLPSTTGMVNLPLLTLLKPGATLINTARGGLVNEPDLIEFLRARPDAQALLDVTEPEPPAPDSPLWELPNIFLTPHIAGSLGAECRRMGAAMIENLHRYARSEPLQHTITREQFARRA